MIQLNRGMCLEFGFCCGWLVVFLTPPKKKKKKNFCTWLFQKALGNVLCEVRGVNSKFCTSIDMGTFGILGSV